MSTGHHASDVSNSDGPASEPARGAIEVRRSTGVPSDTTPAPAGAVPAPIDCAIFQTLVPGLGPEALQHHELSPQQMAAVHLLARGMSDLEVARHLNVSRMSVFRWRTRKPDFRLELARQRQASSEQAADRLGALLDPAVSVLERQFADPAVVGNPSLALRLANTVVRLTLAQRPEVALRDAQRDVERQRRRATDQRTMLENVARRSNPASLGLPPRKK
ncbi:MAG: helix-turn-helix domain-containing protein [Tepidisphaeraceae bacterium]